jgi:virginiamycin B lyase
MEVDGRVTCFTHDFCSDTGRFCTVVTPAPGGEANVTVGPDGSVWFIAPIGILRLTSDGAIKLYDGTALGLRDITLGPDGALWFTGWDSQGIFAVRRMATNGLITYPLPFGYHSCYPAEGIVTGPDKAIWFTCGQGNAIVRIALP